MNESGYEGTRAVRLVIIMAFFLVSYLLYSLTKHFYTNYQVEKYITQFKEENRRLEQENRQKNEDYLYYTSPQYVDKIIKQNRNMVNPGEQVIIIAAAPTAIATLEEDALLTEEERKSNFERWMDLFF